MVKMDLLLKKSLLPQAKVSYHSSPFWCMDIDSNLSTKIPISNKSSPSVVTIIHKICMPLTKMDIYLKLKQKNQKDSSNGIKSQD